MSTQFDIEAMLEATAAKVAPKPKATLKECSNDSCKETRVPRSQFCQAHKEEYDSLRAERNKGYLNLVRDAMTAANKIEETDDNTYSLRLTKGNVGFAYFVKEAMPNKVDKNHTFGGLVFKVVGKESAMTVGRIFAESDIAKVEGFGVQLVAVIDL